jgi:hypothetical protein
MTKREDREEIAKFLWNVLKRQLNEPNPELPALLLKAEVMPRVDRGTVQIRLPSAGQGPRFFEIKISEPWS